MMQHDSHIAGGPDLQCAQASAASGDQAAAVWAPRAAAAALFHQTTALKETH